MGAPVLCETILAANDRTPLPVLIPDAKRSQSVTGTQLQPRSASPGTIIAYISNSQQRRALTAGPVTSNALAVRVDPAQVSPLLS